MRERILIVVVSFAVAVPALVTAAPADARPETPFVSTRPGEVIVPVILGGLGPYRFLLDTGSTHTAVTRALAIAVDARPVARTAMRTAGGTVECAVVKLPTLTVGAAAADGLTATLLPPQAHAALGAGVDGVLGQDFLSPRDFTIDYRRLRILWHQPGYVAPGTRLALVPADDRWVVELPQSPRRPGQAPMVRRFVPDSGADTLVLFGTAPADGLVSEWRAGSATFRSLTGLRPVRTATIDGLRVGAAVLDRQLAAVLPADAEDEPDGLLPLHLFASVFFSARDRTMVILPR